ncbi:hypothetical protein Leryth_014818 [Lithospermum erythrorhizon]|nr:hypothetical protein Leryth_014818 [Lithospermum erythrorhizon]
MVLCGFGVTYVYIWLGLHVVSGLVLAVKLDGDEASCNDKQYYGDSSMLCPNNGNNKWDLARDSILQLTMVVVLTRLLVFFLKPFRQPRVISEILYANFLLINQRKMLLNI